MRAQGSRDIVTPSCAHPSSEATEILEGLLPLCFWPLERVKIPARKLHLGHPLFPRIPPSSMFEETRRTPANYPRLITLPPCQFVAKIPIPEESYIESSFWFLLYSLIWWNERNINDISALWEESYIERHRARINFYDIRWTNSRWSDEKNISVIGTLLLLSLFDSRRVFQSKYKDRWLYLFPPTKNYSQFSIPAKSIKKRCTWREGREGTRSDKRIFVTD